MKTKEQNEARKLRSQGNSIGEIATKLAVSKGSVSRWVRDVELSDEQRMNLDSRNPAMCYSAEHRMKQAKSLSKTWTERRRLLQQEGRQIVARQDVDFIAGCMLYWAEGDKSRTTCGLSNSDPDMILWFVGWLRRFFSPDESRISIRLNVYLNNGMTLEDVESYWLNTLALTRDHLNKSIVNHFPTSSSGGKRGKLPYGTCQVRLNDVSVVQKIYGAIKQYVGIDDDRWLD